MIDILKPKRHTAHPKGDALYKQPLYKVREVTNLKDMLDESTRLFGTRDAFWVKEPRVFDAPAIFDRRGLPERLEHYRPVQYKRFSDDVRALASSLYARPQDEVPLKRVAILGNSRYEWYVSYLATVRGPAVVVPLDRELPDNELLSCLDRADVDTLFVSGDLREKVKKLEPELPRLQRIIAFDQPDDGDLSFWDLLHDGYRLNAADKAPDIPPIDPDALAVLLFTSGTTSQSKAVMLSQRNIASNLMMACSLFHIGPEDRMLSVLPLHHTYECTCGFLCAMFRGTCVAIGDGLRYITQNIREAEPTLMLLVPLMLEAFYNRMLKKVNNQKLTATRFRFGLTFSKSLQKIGLDISDHLFQSIHDAFPGIKSFIVGGAAVDSTLIYNWRALGFNCLQGYGLTESSPILALNHDQAPKATAAGLPVPGVDIRIINPDEDGVGEVIAKGPNVMLGYYEDPEKTAAATDADGYLHTGDLGYLDEDYNLILTGRKANLIVSANGKNIFPEEIESLFKEFPLVEEVIVRLAKDTRGGEQLVAEIYPSRDAMEEDPELANLSFDHPKVHDRCLDIVAQVNKNLANYKHLRAVLVRTEPFEKTTTKKIRRGRISDAPVELD